MRYVTVDMRLAAVAERGDLYDDFTVDDLLLLVAWWRANGILAAPNQYNEWGNTREASAMRGAVVKASQLISGEFVPSADRWTPTSKLYVGGLSWLGPDLVAAANHTRLRPLFRERWDELNKLAFVRVDKPHGYSTERGPQGAQDAFHAFGEYEKPCEAVVEILRAAALAPGCTGYLGDGAVAEILEAAWAEVVALCADSPDEPVRATVRGLLRDEWPGTVDELRRAAEKVVHPDAE